MLKIPNVIETTQKHIAKQEEELAIQQSLYEKAVFPQEKEEKLAQLRRELKQLEREIDKSLRENDNSPIEQSTAILNIDGVKNDEDRDDQGIINDIIPEDEEDNSIFETDEEEETEENEESKSETNAPRMRWRR